MELKSSEKPQTKIEVSFGQVVDIKDKGTGVVVATYIDTHKNYPSFETAIAVSIMRRDEEGKLFLALAGTERTNELTPTEEFLTLEEVLEGFKNIGADSVEFIEAVTEDSKKPSKKIRI